MNATLNISYQDPATEQQSVQLCGGLPKGLYEVAPPDTSSLIFFGKAGEAKEKTFVIFNKGNGTLTVSSLDLAMEFASDPVPFSLETTWDPTPLAAFEIRPVTVKYDTTLAVQSGQNVPILNAKVTVNYLGDTGGAETDTVTLQGNNDNFIRTPATGTTPAVYYKLPTADIGTAADYAGAKVGAALTLNGSRSDGGDFTIPATGYIWFVSKKPAQSQVFLNDPAGGTTETVIPDVAGDYEFRLVVSSQNQSDYYFSDEAAVTVTVAAGP
jgi:hypothetical protein